MCRDCWDKANPGREPYALAHAPMECCCFCGATHASGIRVRENWAFTMCRGETGIHKEDSDAREQSAKMA
jgi:hypothetical protein